MENEIREGIVALQKGTPVFVHNRNEVIEFTEMSQQQAALHNGQKLKIRLVRYNIHHDFKASIVEIIETPKAVVSIKMETMVSQEQLRYLFYAGWNSALEKREETPHALCKEAIKTFIK